jgi:hypothetical protein
VVTIYDTTTSRWISGEETVQDRLDELVELEVLDKYEYTNQTLYDLAYDPILTDGGRLQDASMLELITLQDRTSLRDLAAAPFSRVSRLLEPPY